MKFDLYNLIPANFAPLKDLPALVSGVYCIFDDEDTLLYVGQSCDVRSRISAHRRKKWGPAIERVEAVLIGRESDRLVAEAVHILRHRPRYNRSIKLGLYSNPDRIRELAFVSHRSGSKRK
jgi:excinuclease UvrABC nuclease subunit